MSQKVIRTMMAVVLVGATLNPMVAAAQKKPDNSDIENIGNRDINDGVFSNWNFTSLEKEIALGRQLAAELESQVRLVDDPVINEYVNRVGQNLVRNSDAQVPFSFKVIEDDTINALSLPGGFIYINTGILLTADEEAELAGVLAHEVAHVTARHGTENATKGQILNLATIPLIFLGGAVGFGIQQAAGIAIPMQFMKFSRGAEEEADFLGTQYMYKTGYDPGAAVTFFEKVQARETAKPGTMSSLFSSHPPTESRIEKTKTNIGLVLPDKEQYVITTSEFQDVQSLLIAYENRQPVDVRDESRPSLRRRTPVPTSEADEQVVTETGDEGPPVLERNSEDPDRLPEDEDRPVLRRRTGGDI